MFAIFNRMFQMYGAVIKLQMTPYFINRIRFKDENTCTDYQKKLFIGNLFMMFHIILHFLEKNDRRR